MMEETVSFLPFSVLSRLSPDNSQSTLDACINFLVEYVLTLTMQGTINALLVDCNSNGGYQFLQTIGIGVRDDGYSNQCKVVSFTHNFRFVLGSTENKKVLTKQLYAVIPIIKTFLYSSKKNVKNATCAKDCKQCKLKSVTERFVNFNYQRFHLIYCNKGKDDASKIEILRSLTPDNLRNNLEQLLEFLTH